MQRQHFTLHQGFGAALALLLLLLALSGTMAVYKTELALWVAGPAGTTCTSSAVPAQVAALAYDPAVRRITLPGYDSPFFQLKYRDGTVALFDQCGQPAQRSGQLLSTFLVELHSRFFLGHEGRWLIGVLALGMLVSTLTGLLSLTRPWRRHLQRQAGGQKSRSKWSIWHKRLGLCSLPALLLFAITGIWLGLYGLIMPAWSLWSADSTVRVVQPVAEKRLLLAGASAGSDNAGNNVYQQLLEQSALYFPQLQPVFIEQRFAGNNLLQLSVRGDHPGALVQRHRSGVDYDVKRAVLQRVMPGQHSLAMRLELMMMPLHFGDWGPAGAINLLVKALYALAGLVCSALLAAGLWLWAFRRQRYEGWLGNASAVPGRLMLALSGAFAVALWASPLLAKLLLAVTAEPQLALFYLLLLALFSVLALIGYCVGRGLRSMLYSVFVITLATLLTGIADMGWWHGFHLVLLATLLGSAVYLLLTAKASSAAKVDVERMPAR